MSSQWSNKSHNHMPITVAQVDGLLFEGVADALTVPGAEGELTVYVGHEPFVTTLKPGRVIIRGIRSSSVAPKHTEDGQCVLACEGGILEVTGESATVIF